MSAPCPKCRSTRCECLPPEPQGDAVITTFSSLEVAAANVPKGTDAALELVASLGIQINGIVEMDNLDVLDKAVQISAAAGVLSKIACALLFDVVGTSKIDGVPTVHVLHTQFAAMAARGVSVGAMDGGRRRD